ncbi:TIGR02996 domain-containing protein [Gemmata sp. G18]|uniref:TIGR02996 domain-containing protein n=1 Tax=Gemmata palustris TaxID=2822762 RepID=A0ABS5BNE7_9BACT|nr:TIGR02996 domain-containing protein [Gemmata palustris]MBP3955236.1 TIGR02996 domain-containing protein [Gemmata palustris]
MSTEAALLRAIREMPDEDTPRLVYADYLDEEGDAARAEFIRVQVERARLPEGAPQRAALEDREHDLLAQHERAWLGVAPDDMDGLTEWEFERGFVNEIAANPYFMLGPGSDLCAAHPVRRWRVQGGQMDMIEDLRETGQKSWFGRLEAIDLAGWYTTIGELGQFLCRSNFARLRELDLTARPGLDALPELLGYAPFRDQLKILRCGAPAQYYDEGRLDVWELVRALGTENTLEELTAAGAQLTADDLGGLLAAACCQSLTSLDIRYNQIAPNGWEAFRDTKCRLRELDISGTPLGAISLDNLLGCASVAELQRLQLNGCGSAITNLRALARSRFWTRAEALRMQQGSVPEISLDPLFTSTGSPALRVLDVGQNWLRDGGVAQLCEAPWAGSLTYLDLSSNYLTDEALRALARSGRFKNLHTLHLNFNSVYHQDGAEHYESLTDNGLRALAECIDLANLRVLSVSGTRITDAGVDAILNSPHWRLSGLRLSQCQLRRSVLDVLASSPRLARLQVLDLSRNDEIDVDDLSPLAESEYLSPQTELDISGMYNAHSAVRTALIERLGRRLSE